jgi:hypothetical protein
MPLKKFSFRPFFIFPLLSVTLFVLSTIVSYALFLGAFKFSKELLISEVLSVGCGPSLLGSFAPNVLELGFSLGLVSLAFLFLFKYPDDLKLGPRRTASFLLFIGLGFLIVFLFWMMSFPTGRGAPWDLFHQVTAGIGVFGALLYVLIDSFSAKRSPRKMQRRVVAVAGTSAGVAMAITYFILKASPPSLTIANIFASFQFAFMAFFFLYILLLTNNKRISVF